MQLTKHAALLKLKSRNAIDAIHFSSDEILSVRLKEAKETQKQIERLIRQNKNLTIIILD